ncbi:prolyl oligopeptidase family protein [Microbacterium sp. AG1240]|uniref:alpha/beta hydrolase family protein n=1 Tax=Microbacterium sp. AG1240 TaxID=2183992 RepID=UPI000EAFAC34|nr:alpha/beta hydrolase [Microbacterium sp. AG1240]RKT36912.1 prolyl oligopeptidase family protein [Microbacterium sp. AG1240]
MSAPEAAHRILRYGPLADQYVEVTSPVGSPRGTVVLIHGGYWRRPFTAELMRPLVPTFVADGWVVANVEYRRGSEGWAATAADLTAALAAARSAGEVSRLAIIGHSVGGQLALLGSSEGDAVVALAPVTDLVRGSRERIGDGAVAEFFGESTDTIVAASPLAHVPPGGDVLVVHGRDDARVPIEHTRDYVEAARSAGAHVDFIEVPQLSHLQAIDPAASHWPDVRTWLDRRRD